MSFSTGELDFSYFFVYFNVKLHVFVLFQIFSCLIGFYCCRKSCDQVKRFRSQAVELLERSNNEPSLMTFYISRQWLNKLNTFAEPGPIDNTDFLCHHGGVRPDRINVLQLMYTTVSHAVWECLYNM